MTVFLSTSFSVDIIAPPAFSMTRHFHAYLNWFGEALRREQCALHAYVLMTNHIRLLVTPERAASIPRLIIAIGRRYVQYINHTYRRTGTLWDSRYKSSLVQEETYLLFCQRYVELNPVRAAMVTDPADYRWSSYRHNAFGEPDPVLTPHSLYLTLGANAVQRQAAYRNLFASAGRCPVMRSANGVEPKPTHRQLTLLRRNRSNDRPTPRVAKTRSSAEREEASRRTCTIGA